MSLKSRLQSIEKKFEDEKPQHDEVQADREDLLFADYEEYRSTYVQWLMSKYMQDHEQTVLMEQELERLNKSLQPISSPQDFDADRSHDLLVKKIVDWMEDNEVKDLDEDRWEELQQELQD